MRINRTWWQLRPVGNLKFLKASYIALAVIPFLSRHEILANLLGIPRWFLATTFFGSVFLALANLIYDICCPIVVKRFASANDLYQSMLSIKETSRKLYPYDGFNATLNHCKCAYRRDSRSKPLWRGLCTILFYASGILFLVVLGYRLIIVTAFFLGIDTNNKPPASTANGGRGTIVSKATNKKTATKVRIHIEYDEANH